MSDLPEVSPALEHEIDAVAVLKDPIRRVLFLYVARAPEDVSRDQAADAAGISRALAAFHLDKLVDEGLLEISFRRLNGRSGPGAGRPSKLYRRSAREVSLSLPAREYELVARILARAMEADPPIDPRTAVQDVAREAGEAIGEKAGAAGGRRRSAALTDVLGQLADHGFEPYQDGRKIYLANCPFHSLSRDHTQLVCGMNLSLMQGLVQGAATGLEARLDPAEGRCCVVLERTKR